MACNLLVPIYTDVLLDFIFGKNFQKLMGVWGNHQGNPTQPQISKQVNKQKTKSNFHNRHMPLNSKYATPILKLFPSSNLFLPTSYRQGGLNLGIKSEKMFIQKPDSSTQNTESKAKDKQYLKSMIHISYSAELGVIVSVICVT